MEDDRRLGDGRRSADQVAAELGRLAKEAGQAVDHLEQSRGEIGEVIDRFDAARAEVIETVRQAKESVDYLADQVGRLVPRSDVFDVEVEQMRRRKRVTVALFWVIVAAVQINDLHTITILGERPDLIGVSAFLADMFFPTHIHGHERLWPTTANGVGLVLYAVLGIVSRLWITRVGKTVIGTKQTEEEHQ